MLDITLFQTEKGGNPELIRQSQIKRGAKPETVDEIIALYTAWTKLKFDLDNFNRDINATQKLIGQKYKAKEDASELVATKEELVRKKEQCIAAEVEAKQVLDNKLKVIGNLVHDSVPVSLTEDDNLMVATNNTAGEPVKVDGILSHHELLYRIGGYDPERGTKVASHRGYFLTGVGVELNMAIINYGMRFLNEREFKLMQTPFFMKRSLMAKTAQLEDFDEALYKIVDNAADDQDEKYLIATSEQPISAYHSGEWVNESELPLKYGGYSTNFRKEAGKHGKDTWGIFRVHQFEKLEQLVFTEPEKSWAMHEEMLRNAEEFNQSLGLKYRVINIVSGALNNAAAKKYDLEAWFPYQGEYKELVSASNCTDYQSRPLEIRCGSKKLNETEKRYVHCLNATLSATGRTICAILENWQTPTGVKIPPVLVPYMGGKTHLPFVRDMPAPPTGAATKAKKK
ncbi:cytoplasmic serine-tRNA ligase Srs1 [Ramicandelaber brevisporus]|nr:cytoplasmic serine-tRNA ligase Srs1 [Ramicandelaber brevisporus]